MNPYLDLLGYISIIIVGGFLLSFIIRSKTDWQKELFLGIVFNDFQKMVKALKRGAKIEGKCGGEITAQELAKNLRLKERLEVADLCAIFTKLW